MAQAAQAAQAAQTRPTSAVQTKDLSPKQVANKVLAEMNAKVDRGDLQVPPDYSVGNAVNSAYLKLLSVQDKNRRPALEVVSKASLANSLRQMVCLGLSPEKDQCYFIVYDADLTCRISYFGFMMLAKRVDPRIDDFCAYVVFKDDKISVNIENGRQVVTDHQTNPFAKHTKEDVVGAYCNVIYKDGHYVSTIMNMDQIERGWSVGNAQTGSKAHRLTWEEMIKRSVISRACKPIIKASTDRSLFGKAVAENEMEAARMEHDEAVRTRTNVVDVDFEQAAPKELPEPAPAEEPPELEPVAETETPAVEVNPDTGEVLNADVLDPDEPDF